MEHQSESTSGSILVALENSDMLAIPDLRVENDARSIPYMPEYKKSPDGLDFIVAEPMLLIFLIAIFAAFSFNAYYLRKKRKNDPSIAKSIIWTNALFAIFSIGTACIVYTIYLSEQMDNMRMMLPT